MTPIIETLTLRSYAKINLTLDVFSKRADGYHSIASILQTISLHDTLTLQRQEEPGVRFTCHAPGSPDVPSDATNLVVRAIHTACAAAFEAAESREETHSQTLLRTEGVAVHLDKQIPSQAGLGGGSSNAAAALIGVNSLFDLGLDTQKIASLAAELGSDVPFFLVGGTATARGRGEILTPLQDSPPLWMVIVKPEESVSTGWAYGQLDADPERQSHRGTKRVEEALQNGDIGRLIAFQCNDFELPVFNHYPGLAWLHDELKMAGALTAHLCGSGSACYGIADNETAAHRIAALMRRRHARVYIARTLTRAESHPLSTSLPVSTPASTLPSDPEGASPVE